VTRVRREAEATYVCPDQEECGYEWKVEGRYTAEGDFEPNDEDDTNCPECDSVGEYRDDVP
jgi:hypothetical protein